MLLKASLNIVVIKISDRCNRAHIFAYIVGSESVTMFGSFGLFAVWCYIV
jgi:hypothetical protein